MERAKVIEEIKKRAKDNRIPCRSCFEIAAQLGVEKRELGRLLDELGIKVIECQLGLFK